MNPTLEQQITGSLDADPALIPFLPELLTDLDELGSSAEQVVGVLAPLKLPREAGVASHCEFRCADLRQALSESRHFDLVLMLGIGPVLGDQSATS